MENTQLGLGMQLSCVARLEDFSNDLSKVMSHCKLAIRTWKARNVLEMRKCRCWQCVQDHIEVCQHVNLLCGNAWSWSGYSDAPWNSYYALLTLQVCPYCNPKRGVGCACESLAINFWLFDFCDEADTSKMGGKRGRPSVAVVSVAAQEISLDYEKERNAVLEANRKRMMELGLLTLASDVAAGANPKSAKANRAMKSKIKTTVTTARTERRRSSRLKGVEPVKYSEQLFMETERRSSKLSVGTKPEIYTEEDEKLLGSYEEPWELFVDGVDAQGNRIYDKLNGKTCHQCRQKTLGHRTTCSSCEALHGEFCGDCLFMRYGENVLEAKRNKKWVCPVCRGICNCSFCRPKRGWGPTGSMYRRAIAEGYKSVAHYLIFTRRGSPDQVE